MAQMSAVAAPRDRSIDALRGLIIALMALDHVRIFLSSAQFDPIDLERTNAALFLTRWITHLCAPGFFFLAGLGIALFEVRADRPTVRRFLLVRGFFLIAMEVLVFGLAWSFHPGWWWFGVIWGLGAAMVLMAALVSVPKSVLLVVAGLFTLLHNSLWPAGSSTANTLLYAGGFVSPPITGERLVIYPLLPWLALMVLGYATARWFAPDRDPRGRVLLTAGITSLTAFLLLRLVGFGGPVSCAEATRSLLAMLNVEKYPPSLQFSLVTIGACLVLIGLARRWPALTSGIGQPLVTLGRVPFFFYTLHLFAIHGFALALAALLGWQTSYLFWPGPGPNLIPPDGYGLGLAGVYAVWVLILAALYPACTAFARLKQRHPSFWLKLF
jgi:uncharacterized membrane protein